VVTIQNCDIVGNFGSWGGGVWGSPIMENCRVIDNQGYGGGVYGAPTMIGCTIEGNRSHSSCGSDGDPGGGVLATSTSCLLVDCVIRGNTSFGKYPGGGVYGPATLRNCLIVDNVDEDYYGSMYGTVGGGVYGARSIEGCTIANNIIEPQDLPPKYWGKGGGLANCENVVDSIIWGNFPDAVYAVPVIRFCDVQGGAPGEGNIDAAPLFTDPVRGIYDLHVFRFDGKAWSHEAKLIAADAAGLDEFGNAVALSGNRALVGARYEDAGGADAGAAYVFRFEGPYGEDQPDSTSPASTMPYATRGDSFTWVEEAKLVAVGAKAGDHFGWSVALDGKHAVIGARHSDAQGTDSGTAYLFEVQGGLWAQLQQSPVAVWER
jgi:FG-GAP repeat